jgi:hypothetical protein
MEKVRRGRRPFEYNSATSVNLICTLSRLHGSSSIGADEQNKTALAVWMCRWRSSASAGSGTSTSPYRLQTNYCTDILQQVAGRPLVCPQHPRCGSAYVCVLGVCQHSGSVRGSVQRHRRPAGAVVEARPESERAAAGLPLVARPGKWVLDRQRRRLRTLTIVTHAHNSGWPAIQLSFGGTARSERACSTRTRASCVARYALDLLWSLLCRGVSVASRHAVSRCAVRDVKPYAQNNDHGLSSIKVDIIVLASRI